MSEYQGWFPSSRVEVLFMAKNWNEILALHAQQWLIPPQDLTDLVSLTGTAEEVLQKAMSSERTQAITEQCREAFVELEAKMRFIKKRFFYVPPLTSGNIIALGLKLHDSKQTPIPIPDIPIEVSFTSPGIHQIDVHLGPQIGAITKDKRSLYSFTVRYGVMPIGGPATREQVLADRRLLAAVPVRPEDLPCVFSTRRRTRRLDFNLDDSGKTLYICGCYQNPRDETGPWCAIQSRLIP